MAQQTNLMKYNLLIGFYLVFVATEFVDAQSFYNQGQLMISPGTDFFVRDSLVNKGTFTNNGNMIMGGVWLNQGTYVPGTGEITFNSLAGAASQVINHNNQTFGKLTISGGGDKIILADMSIEGELILINGIIKQQNNSKVTFTSAASFTGASDASHIQTPIVWQGAGTKVFPIGNGQSYLPVTLTNVEGASTLIQVEGIEDATSFIPGNDLQEVFNNRYWRVEALNGSLASSKIELPMQALPTPYSNRFVVAQASTVQSQFSSLGQSQVRGTSSSGFLSSSLPPSLPIIALGVAVELPDGLLVYNAISPNMDDKNDYLIIGNIDKYPENKVSIFNRWGDLVFEQKNYDNTSMLTVFKGVSSSGKLLPSGVYFYKIEAVGTESKSGFLTLKN
jgi:gliding motility-associated-like protein